MPKRPKKSKYKHTVIKNKKYYFYKITWKDITGDAGHATSDEFEKFLPSTMITQAYVFKKIVRIFGPLRLMKMVMSYFLIEMFFQKVV